jgi:hypothetical protein
VPELGGRGGRGEHRVDRIGLRSDPADLAAEHGLAARLLAGAGGIAPGEALLGLGLTQQLPVALVEDVEAASIAEEGLAHHDALADHGHEIVVAPAAAAVIEAPTGEDAAPVAPAEDGAEFVWDKDCRLPIARLEELPYALVR